jgi:hypothetical protein
MAVSRAGFLPLTPRKTPLRASYRASRRGPDLPARRFPSRDTVLAFNGPAEKGIASISRRAACPTCCAGTPRRSG